MVRTREVSTGAATDAIRQGEAGVDMVRGEVHRRRAALEACDPEKQDCRPFQVAYEQSLQVLSSLDREVSQSTGWLRRCLVQIDNDVDAAVTFLSRLQQVLMASPDAPRAQGGGVATRPPTGDGRLGPGASASAAAASHEYSTDLGFALNAALWLSDHAGVPLSSEMASLCSRLDEAMRQTAPLSVPMQVNRDCGLEILQDLGAVDVEGRPSQALASLNAGPAAHHAGFLSTSTGQPFAHSSGYRVHMTITATPGTRMMDLRSHAEGGSGLSAHASESELLLDRDGLLVVTAGSATSWRDPSGVTHFAFHAFYVPRLGGSRG